MNKNFIKVAFVAAIAMVGGVNAFNSQKTESLSDIALANVEALADGETSEEFTERTDCIACMRNHSCRGKDGQTYSWAHHKDDPSH